MTHTEACQEGYRSTPLGCPVSSLRARSVSLESNLLPARSSTRARAHSHCPQLDTVFTVLFIVELCVNLFAHWFWPFVTSGWSHARAHTFIHTHARTLEPAYAHTHTLMNTSAGSNFSI